MGYKYVGPDKSVQDDAKILAEIRARTDVIDRKLQNPKLSPADRDALTTQRKLIEKDVRSSFGGAQMSPEDKQALEWANKNPSDPRAAAIKQKLGQ
jgi:hypothetical protein